MTPLSLETPPVVYPLQLRGVQVNSDGLIAEQDLLGVLDRAIGAYETLMEQYGVETDTADAA